MTDRESIFEDNLERSYWDFILNTTTLKGYSQRDCFKMACRKNLKPKPEKKMTDKRVIFESEEECLQVLELYCLCSDREKGIKNTFENIKRAGFIRKNPVEEAEKIYNAFSDSDDRCASNLLELMIKQHEAIQYLKEKNHDK